MKTIPLKTLIKRLDRKLAHDGKRIVQKKENLNQGDLESWMLEDDGSGRKVQGASEARKKLKDSKPTHYYVMELNDTLHEQDCYGLPEGKTPVDILALARELGCLKEGEVVDGLDQDNAS